MPQTRHPHKILAGYIETVALAMADISMLFMADLVGPHGCNRPILDIGLV
jgi:hypothetical protein